MATASIGKIAIRFDGGFFRRIVFVGKRRRSRMTELKKVGKKVLDARNLKALEALEAAGILPEQKTAGQQRLEAALDELLFAKDEECAEFEA